MDVNLLGKGVRELGSSATDEVSTIELLFWCPEDGVTSSVPKFSVVIPSATRTPRYCFVGSYAWGGFNPQNPHNPHYQESKERVPCMPESRRDQLRHALNMGPHPTNDCPQPPLLAFE